MIAVSHLARALAGSISDLHHAGVVHGDLKLRNALVSTHSNEGGYQVSNESEVVLCDLDTSGAIGSERTLILVRSKLTLKHPHSNTNTQTPTQVHLKT